MKQVRVFLSSTAEDMQNHRDRVALAIEQLGETNIRMETFGAQPEAPIEVCKREVASADVVVAMVAWRYGWVPPKDKGGDNYKSITRIEVETAYDRSIPVLAFVVDPNYAWTQKKEQDSLLEKPPEEAASVKGRVDALKNFKEFLGSITTIKHFTTADDLAVQVTTSLSRWLQSKSEVRSANHLVSPQIAERWPLANPQWVISINSDGLVEQTDDEIALIISEMLTQDELLHAMPVSIDRNILIDSIGLYKVYDVVEHFREFYRVIPNSLALHALIHDMDSKANLSLDERKKRLDAVKLAKLLQQIESDLDTGLLAILNAVGRYLWLSNAKEASETIRSFLELYFVIHLGRDWYTESPSDYHKVRIDVWREDYPPLSTFVRLNQDDVEALEASLRLRSIEDLRFYTLTASSLSHQILRRQFIPRIIMEIFDEAQRLKKEKLDRDVLELMKLLDRDVLEHTFKVGRWRIGLG